MQSLEKYGKIRGKCQEVQLVGNVKRFSQWEMSRGFSSGVMSKCLVRGKCQEVLVRGKCPEVLLVGNVQRFIKGEMSKCLVRGKCQEVLVRGHSRQTTPRNDSPPTRGKSPNYPQRVGTSQNGLILKKFQPRIVYACSMAMIYFYRLYFPLQIIILLLLKLRAMLFKSHFLIIFLNFLCKS